MYEPWCGTEEILQKEELTEEMRLAYYSLTVLHGIISKIGSGLFPVNTTTQTVKKIVN